MGSDLWSLLSPKILAQVEYLAREGKIGLCAGTINITDICKGCSLYREGPLADRFKIVLPYAGQSLKWEVIFNHEYPELPPDFIFSPEEHSFLPDVDSLKGLINWDIDDPKCLLTVIQGLLVQLKKHQFHIISSNSRLQFELNSLLESKFSLEDLEIHAEKRRDSKLGSVRFLIRLPVEFSQIPPYLIQFDPGEDMAVLLVTFLTPDGTKITPQLYLSPRVEHALGGSGNLRIPPFLNGGCLIDYVPSVCELLQSHVEQIVQGFEKRKDYIAAFLSLYGRSVLEYDTEGFSKISFIFEWNDFFFIVSIEMLPRFPNDQPVFMFQSIYHETSQEKPFYEIIKNYPYSPRWSAMEMADRARSFILDHAGTFQKASIQNTRTD